MAAALVVAAPAAYGLAATGSADQPDSFAEAQHQPDSFAEAQQAYDPTDEPETVINQEDDGSYGVVQISMIESRLPDGFPTLEEAGVKSLADEHEYIRQLDAYFKEHPQALQEGSQGGP